MEEVLTAIADAVGVLVCAFVDSEEKGTMFNDMVPAAEGIQMAVSGMVLAAEETLKVVDDEFRTQLTETTEGLKKSSQRLVDEAYNVRKDLKDRVPQRAAIQAAKSILQKVTSLVLLEEMMNITKLVKMAKRVGEATMRLNDVNSVPQAEVIMDESLFVSKELTKRVFQRARDSKSGDFSQALSGTCNELTDAIVQHHNIARRFLSEMADDLITQRNKLSNRVLELLDELIEGVKALFEESSKFIDTAFKWQPIRTIAEEEVLKAKADLVALLANLHKGIAQGDGAARARAIVQAAHREMEYANAVAEATKDPLKRLFIKTNIEELKKLTPKLLAAVKPVMQNPNDAHAAALLEAAIRETTMAAESLATTVAYTPAEALAIHGNRLASDLDALADAIKRGDKVTANAILTAMDGAFDRHIKMAEAYADSLTDPHRRTEVKNAIQKLKDLKNPIMAAAREAINTNSPEAYAKLGGLIKEAKDAIYAISHPSEMVAALGAQFGYDLDALARIFANPNDPNMAQNAIAMAKNIANDAQRQVAAAEAYAATITNQERKQEIGRAAAAVRNETAQLMDAIKASLANPNDQQKRDKLERLIASTKDASANLTRVAQPTPDDIQEQFRAARGGSVLEYGLAHQSGPINEAVMAAAQQMAAAIKGKYTDDSPLGKLFQFSKSIADDMAALSAFAAQGNKKEMISAARKIAEAVKQVVVNANTISSECSDPILKASVMSYANGLSNYGTQLKIIAAVKAASDENDPTAEAQLITCSKGICDGVVGVASAGESAVIKSRQNPRRR